MKLSNKIRNIVGERFERLLVVGFSHISQDKGRNAYWKCLCDCGNFTTVHSGALRTGSTRSCGCLAAELNKTRIRSAHKNGKHLYLIQCNEFTKIGRSDSPEQRLKSLQASTPYEVFLVKVWENKGYLEHKLHARYEKYRVRGEWFKFT